MKLNLGAGPNWECEGWSILDHKIKKNTKNRIAGDLNDIKIKKISVKLFLLAIL